MYLLILSVNKYSVPLHYISNYVPMHYTSNYEHIKLIVLGTYDYISNYVPMHSIWIHVPV